MTKAIGVSFQTHGMISTVAEHSVDLDLLPQGANILDIGCRDFTFCDHMRSLGHHVWPVDIDRLPEGRAYYNLAIGGEDGRCGVLRTVDKQATRRIPGNEVPCYTLETFSLSCEVDFWHLIKIDAEGDEYTIIMGLKTAPAKMISVEFHCHTGQITQPMMREMENKLKNLGYEFAQHEMTQAHGAGWNFWSSLFILK